MKQSQLFTKITKEAPKDEVSFNASVLIRAGFISKLAAGIYSFLPLGHRVHEKIKNIVKEEINAISGQEIFMPAMTPKDVWETTGRWKSFDVLFKFMGMDKKEYALGATHEEIVTPLVRPHVFSYKDLPVYVYQIQTKFRNELRAKSGLLRCREFSMKDLYSFHRDEEDLNEYYKLVQKAYFKIFERCGLLNGTYLTFASGGAFSKYSHEFQTVSDAGEDTIHICEDCKVAINEEIIGEQPTCPACGNSDLRPEKAIEVGNIFKLGTRFSKPFNLAYTDENGDKKDVIMGSYGIGPARTMGAIVEIHHDERGIIWPEEVAPFVASLLKLKNKNEKVKTDKTVEKIYSDLQKAGIEVLYDDREGVSAGERFADADLIGCPYRVVVSEKTLEKDSAEVKRRNSDKMEMVKISNLVNWLNG